MIEFVLMLAYVLVLIAVSYWDIRQNRIPNRIIYPAIAVALLAMWYAPGWRSALVGGLVGMVPMIIPVFIYGPDRAGIGDVKLALFIGLILGFPSVLLALFIAFALATVAGIIGVASKRLTWKSSIPLGPYLAAGAIVCLLLSLS